jgi:excisionase family DNA binding protein
LAATQALIEVAEWSLLATRVMSDDQRRELLSLLRQIGPEATEVRRNLQAAWKQAPPASAAPSTPAQIGTGQVDLGVERLAALESALARIEKGLRVSQATSPDKQAYTVSEAAELTKLSEWTIRNACNKGRIKAEKSADGQWRIPRDVLVKIQNEGLPK